MTRVITIKIDSIEVNIAYGIVTVQDWNQGLGSSDVGRIRTENMHKLMLALQAGYQIQLKLKDVAE